MPRLVRLTLGPTKPLELILKAASPSAFLHDPSDASFHVLNSEFEISKDYNVARDKQIIRIPALFSA